MMEFLFWGIACGSRLRDALPDIGGSQAGHPPHHTLKARKISPV